MAGHYRPRHLASIFAVGGWSETAFGGTFTAGNFQKMEDPYNRYMGKHR